MVDLDALARRARRAAEWGHLRRASRVAFAVVPLTLLSMAVSADRALVAGIGAVLLAISVGLGWWSAEGGRAARAGLKLGAVPMAVALFTVAVEGWCDPRRALTPCGAGCLLAGVFAGAASAWCATRTQFPSFPGRLRVGGAIGLVASLTAALGCVGLGFGSASAVLAALAGGAAVGWAPARARL
jgi:hypothetical protein